MDSRQLQAYLKQVVSLEVQCQTADKAYQTCRNKLNQLGLPKVPPAKPVLNKTVKTEVNSKRRLSFIGRLLIILSIIFVVVTIVFPMCLGILLAATTTSVSFDAGLFRTFIIIAVIAFASGVVCILIAKRTQKQEEAKAQSQIDQQQREYEAACLRYNAVIQKDRQRVESEKAMIPTLQKDIQMLDDRRKKSVQLLDKYYALDVIKPKYRNLLCVATFLEYLENERCYTLTGPDGCYNKFEEERQRGLIIAQLNNISRQLDQIRKTQERVADALDEIQNNTSRLCEGVQGLNGKMDIVMQDQRTIAYYTEQAANDQRVMNNYVMMRDWINS